ncbi:MAG: DUF1127 domain-containing protein [Pseudomonadota bacterium]
MSTLTHNAVRTARPSRKVSLWRLLALWRSRRGLAQLDEAALRDIGISAADAQAEAQRPVWDVPAHWRR